MAAGDPDERLALALGELYAYYRRTEQMMVNIMRDEETMPIVKRMFHGYRDYIFAAEEALMAGRRTSGRVRRRVSAAVGHALAFTTWRSLARDNGLGDDEAAGLMVALVVNAAVDGRR
jgi:hypothetical protein